MSRVISSFICLLFISCERNTDRTKYIKNKTSEVITIIAEGTAISTPNKTLLAGQKETLFITTQLGGTDYVEHPSQGVYYVIIVNNHGDTCTKDFYVQSTWSVNLLQTKKVPSNWEHEYTFIVNDSDF